MTLSSKLHAALQGILGQRDQRLAVSEGRRTVHCDVKQCDPLGVSLARLVLETDELANTDIATLEAASQSLSNRVNYLLEPISPIEIDADGCSVQMRSNPPQKDDNGRRYYELMLRRGGTVTLVRYEKQPGAARQVVPAMLTHEVLGRLVDDFDATVEEIVNP